MGAALTQRPELFRAVLCDFPDLDMVGYHRFPNNNPPALLEYGDASKPEQFQFLYAYSPYQKVKPGAKYPAVLFTTGDADTRVPPLQARKMTARLQAATTSGWPVLLLYDIKPAMPAAARWRSSWTTSRCRRRSCRASSAWASPDGRQHREFRWMKDFGGAEGPACVLFTLVQKARHPPCCRLEAIGCGVTT